MHFRITELKQLTSGSKSEKQINKNTNRKLENIMSTKVEVKPEVESGIDAEVKALLADTTIVTSTTFVKLMSTVDNQQKQVGGKWAALIEWCKGSLLVHGLKEFNTLTTEEKDELKKGKGVILKSLVEGMGKTPSSAQSIRSYIIKMCKPESAEALAKLKAGEITVRASREFGRKPQSNPARSDAAKYSDAVDTVVRYAIAQGFDSAKVYSDIGVKFAEYLTRKEDEAAKVEKAAQDKIEAKAAIEATKQQVANS